MPNPALTIRHALALLYSANRALTASNAAGDPDDKARLLDESQLIAQVLDHVLDELVGL